jgi:hypothetical protein
VAAKAPTPNNYFKGHTMKRLFFLSTLFVLFGALSFAQIKADSAKDNLIKNGDFIGSLDSWLCIGQGTNPYHPQDPGRAEFTVEKGVLKIVIKNQGTSAYSIMVYQSVLFEKGAAYVVSFDAMSDAPMPIVSNVTQDGTYRNFSGDVTLKITAKMTRYS